MRDNRVFFWGKIIMWCAILLVLFFTNPNTPDKHQDAMRKRTNYVSMVLKAYEGNVFITRGVIKLYLDANRTKAQISDYFVFCIGKSDIGITIGILGMVYDISRLFISDQDIIFGFEEAVEDAVRDLF